MKFQNIALIGLGAVGCSYAALMHRSGLNLRIIADEARKARYEDKGVTVNGQPIRFSCLLPGESFRRTCSLWPPSSIISPRSSMTSGDAWAKIP